MTTTLESNPFIADEVPWSVHGGGQLAAFTIALEAWRHGLSVTFLDARPYKFEIADELTSVLFDRGLPGATTSEAFKACNNKSSTINTLHNAGVPVPRGRRLDMHLSQFKDAVKAARDLGYPVVVKPESGSRGAGVFINVETDEHVEESCRHIFNDLNKSRILIEEHIHGDDYRVFVVGDEVAAATWRRPANVTGDGVTPISGLVARKNRSRRANPALSKELISRDLELDRYIAAQGYSWESVPERNSYVRLRGKANLSTGGEIVDVTHLLPTSVRQVAIQAVGAVPGLVSAGVDLLIDKKPEDLDETARATVIELNPRAHIGGHMFPSEGPGHNAAGALVKHFFPSVARRDHPSLGGLSIDIDDILGPLRRGAAEKLTLAPLPEGGYPYRQVFEFSPAPNVRRPARNRISRSSRQWEISGSLEKQDDALLLRLAGQEDQVSAFRKLVEDALKEDSRELGPWRGVVWKGFRLSLD